MAWHDGRVQALFIASTGSVLSSTDNFLTWILELWVLRTQCMLKQLKTATVRTQLIIQCSTMSTALT